VTVRIPELRAIAHRRTIGVLAAALVIAGCASPGTQPSQPPSPSLAAAASSSAAPPTPTSTPTATEAPTVAPAPGWTAVDIPGIDALSDILESDGRLVAAGLSPDRKGAMATSDDGVTWTPVDLSALDSNGPTTIGAGPSGFIAVASTYTAPLGIPELDYLYSDDGRAWHTAVAPADCFAGRIAPHEGGFIGLGGLCKPEGDFAPSPLHVISSPDGRFWTSRVNEQVFAGTWATDGSRLVLFQNDPTGQAPIQVWISDDAAKNWRHVPDALPAGISGAGLLYGHGHYVMPASWLIREGDPDSAVCSSVDGEAWHCEVIPPLAGELAGRHWLGRAIAVTPTGFASLVEYVNDPFFGGDSSTEMVLASSPDGLRWDFTSVPELANKLPSNIRSTSYGLFAWGGTNPNLHPGDVSVPYLDVYRASLP
jgi:hypothetical protein